MKIDFLATEPHYIDHIADVYKALGKDRGFFIVPGPYMEYIEARHNIQPFLFSQKQDSYQMLLDGGDPIVVCSHVDLQRVRTVSKDRPVIFMEHGVGITFPGNPSYAGNVGYRKFVDLTLAPNQYIYDKTKAVIPWMKQEIIGTPKLDKWAPYQDSPFKMPLIPTICISFHWDGRGVAPEAGTAFDHFKTVIEKVHSYFGHERPGKVIAHGHPRSRARDIPFYKKLGIEYVETFDDVMMRADLYINDCSSTLYEFLVTGKPVIVLNSPSFRRNVDFGIRFWRFANVGDHVNDPNELIPTIEKNIESPNAYILSRAMAVDKLYPYFGESATRAANIIRKEFINNDQSA